MARFEQAFGGCELKHVRDPLHFACSSAGAELISRRWLLRLGGSGLLAAAAPGSAASGALRREAARSGRSFGAAVRADRLAEDPALRALLVRECAMLTPELELKWAAVEPVRGSRRMEGADQIAGFARDHGLRLHGHALLWHKSIPAWAEEAIRSGEGWTPIAAHMHALLARYGAIAPTWDVVNEPIDPAAPDGLRASPFRVAFGPDYVRRALDTARGAAPSARLMLNDYGLEYDSAEQRARRAALLALAERLVKAGAPLDGIGVQAHLAIGHGRIDEAGLDEWLRAVGTLGLFVRVTELDVKEQDYVAPAAERDRQVAAEARRFLDVALDHAHVLGVSTWGLSDRDSWLKVEPEDFARFPGAWQDGSSPGFNRGLPFDSSLNAKPMYAAVESALAATRVAAVEPRRTRDARS